MTSAFHSYRTALADRLLKLSFVEAIGGMTTPEWKDFHALMQQVLRAPCGPKTPEVPLCSGHADAWFCGRNHMVSGHDDCVVCCFEETAKRHDATGSPTTKEQS